MRFIAAMDHSGGSTGGVLERYGQEYTEENKMDLDLIKLLKTMPIQKILIQV